MIVANDIVAGLFGLSPFQVQQQQQAALNAEAMNIARMQPQGFEQAGYLMGRAGAGLGMLGAQAAGMVNPEVEAAKQREAIMGSGVDMQTPQGLRALAAKFQAAGMTQQAYIAAAKANEIEGARQKEAAEQRKVELGERKQTFQETEAFDLKKREAEARIRQNDEKIADARTSAAERIELQKESNQIKLMLGQAMISMKQSAAEAKAAQPKPISTIDARSIEKSMALSSGANSAMQLLDQADALYGQYASGRDEPILGGVARWGAAVGMADPKRVADYETAGQIAKDLGVIKLSLIGGSDTERELQVAIDTSPSPDKLPSTNRTIIANQRRAIEVLQAEPDFKTEWINKNGSLSKLDKDTGEPYGKAWRKYQKENFKPVVIPKDMAKTQGMQQPTPASKPGVGEIKFKGWK